MVTTLQWFNTAVCQPNNSKDAKENTCSKIFEQREIL